MKTPRWLVVTTLLVGSLAVTGCASNNSSADVYTTSQTQREETVRFGIVESVRAVQIKSPTSGLGAIGGGAIGAVAGGGLIGQGFGSVAAAVIGGIAGAIAGNAVESSTDKQNGVEITVRLDNGDLRAITQSATSEVFQAGDRVRLLSSGGITRVTH